MSRYKCITGGIVINGQSYKFGKVYNFKENPDPRHFHPIYKVPKGKKVN